MQDAPWLLLDLDVTPLNEVWACPLGSLETREMKQPSPTSSALQQTGSFDGSTSLLCP
ncbi:hypothetical protein GY45DRAFT_1322071 [Cubamyces sp. BRFM 1775]|nr:hypothetical protein GY45DRAFT_1322071 [Cubamyces sp. BRFM 1775]